jgi:hypothetical protein
LAPFLPVGPQKVIADAGQTVFRCDHGSWVGARQRHSQRSAALRPVGQRERQAIARDIEIMIRGSRQAQNLRRELPLIRLEFQWQIQGLLEDWRGCKTGRGKGRKQEDISRLCQNPSVSTAPNASLRFYPTQVTPGVLFHGLQFQH